MRKIKLINLLLVLSSLIGYLEYLHPFILIPFLGQLLLIFSLFQKRPNSLITFWGVAFIGLLYLFILFIGLISVNFAIILSTLPFLGLAIFRIVKRKKIEAADGNA